MDNPSDQYPQIPMNSRRICLGFKDLDKDGRILRRILWIHLAEDMELEEVSERCVLSLKILSGLTTSQLREAVLGTDLMIYYTKE